ncbi:MAG: Fe-Mn family superoxide dismutase, partial [Candidatus Paceibacterota bacterium]
MYLEQKFSLENLKGLSEKQISEHLKLYAGYVKNANELLDKIGKMAGDDSSDKYLLAELRRRMGFEFNGMRLHELYFEALGQSNEPVENNKIASEISKQFGSFENWTKQFKQAGLARGIGWVLLVQDPKNGDLQNIWITDHEVGHLATNKILLALDVWEHAYLLDYLPSQRKEYIEAFF